MTTIIAEIGINHNGSVGIAKKLMAMAKECGADLVKFQKRFIELVYSPEEQAKPRESPWGTTNGDQKRGLEFAFDEYYEIDKYSKKIGLPWFASAWDIPSLEFIETFNPPCHKIASPMITHRKFVESVADLGRLTYVSTGMVDDLKVIQDLVYVFGCYLTPIVLMHCVGEYPCRPVDTNLKMVRTLKREFPDIPIGFSSHAVSPIMGAFAVIMGAVAVEAHITLDRSMYGSDQAASLEKAGLEKLVDYCEMAELAKGDGMKIITERERVNAKKLRYWEAE